MAQEQVPDKYSLLQTHLNELTKTFTVFDGLSRPQFVYTAKSDAKNGDPCIKTEYIFANPTSTTIIGSKETNSTWNSSFDANFTT